MAEEITILQHWIVTKFILPFLLIFVLVYAILEKTKLFGDGKHQINAIISGVIGLIFVGAFSPKIFVDNMMLFLTIGIVIIFVFLMLWGFATGSELKSPIPSKGMKIAIGIFIFVAVGIAVLWAAGVENQFFDLLFRQSWSKTLWTNVAFVVVVAGAIALVLSNK